MLPSEAVSHLDVLSAVGGDRAEDVGVKDASRSRQKGGLWDWLTGAAAPPGRPHFPTMVRIAAMGPAPVMPSATAAGIKAALYQVTIEVETEPSQVDKNLAPRPPATHYVLTTSVVRTASEAEIDDANEEFRHHCKSTVPFARCASFAVTGLTPGTLYEFDVCAANAMGSSEGVQVHVLTPSPTTGSTASAVDAAAPPLEEAEPAPEPAGEDTERTEAQEDSAMAADEESFFDADEHDEHAADAKHPMPDEGCAALERPEGLPMPDEGCAVLERPKGLMLREETDAWEECIDIDMAAQAQARPSRPPTPSCSRPPTPASPEKRQDAERRGQHGTADAAGGPQAPLFPGFIWASGFQVNERQLALGHVEPKEVEQAVEKVQGVCISPLPIKPQQALRLTLGMGTDISAVESKWRQVLSWRREFQMEEERARARELHRNRSVPVSFPYHDEVCRKLLMVSPCSLVTTNGYPVTVWHIGTLNGEAATAVPVEHVNAWSRSFFEYLDVWLAEESDRTSRLLGHIHVFDLEGLSWWHLASGDLLERGRAALHAGEFYVENCYDVYAINASTLFNTVWRLLQRFLSARAASKIVVDSGVPNELLTALGPMAWERLQGVLQAGKSKAQMPILRPPRRGGRAALL